MNTRLKIWKTLAASGLSASLLALSGCSFFFNVEASDEKFYQLPDVGVEAVSTQCPARLSVRDARASGFIQSRKIIFSSSPIEQGYYQFASWTEPPPKRITTILLSAIEGLRYYPSVLHISTANGGELQLSTEVLDFFHDTSQKPGVFRAKIRFELLDMRSRAPADGVTLLQSVPLQRFDSESAVNAASKAVDTIVHDLGKWLTSRCPKAPAPGTTESE